MPCKVLIAIVAVSLTGQWATAQPPDYFMNDSQLAPVVAETGSLPSGSVGHTPPRNYPEAHVPHTPPPAEIHSPGVWYGLDLELSHTNVWFFTSAEFFLRGGPALPIGGGLFENRAQTGIALQGGARQPIDGPWANLQLYGELGFGYIENDGDQVRQPIPGEFISALNGETTQFEVFSNTKLNEFRRTGVHVALGGAFAPAWGNGHPQRVFHLGGRIGGRLGHIDADYDHLFTDDAQTLIDSQSGIPGSIVNLGAKDSEIYLGLFASIGASITWFDVQCFGCCFGSVTCGIELEYTHDWFDLGDYSPNDHGLGTAAPMGYVGITY